MKGMDIAAEADARVTWLGHSLLAETVIGASSR